MDSLDLARWQFGITTVYHFLFVPLTIGMAFLVAGFQTAWYRTGHEKYLRLTKYFGKLFLINFAMGVVTGIVQEFQFGMNWSDYSRFVGDVFGAPLAIEGLLAFFLESTFLGLWIFGWDRLSRRVHLATIWIAATGTLLSAYFILAANSFMQNPVGYEFNEITGRAELTDFVAVLTNKVTLVTFPHTISGAFITAGGLVLGVALWNLIRHSNRDADAFRTAAKAGAATMVIAAALLAVTGDRQAKVMTEVQPMKMAAAEALYHTTDGASFSIFSVGTPDGSEETFAIRVPKMLSFLATGDFNGTVEGINDIQSAYEAKFGPGDYSPNIAVTYWTFRFMIGIGMLGALIAVWAWWRIRRRKGFSGRMAMAAAIALPLTGLLGNSFGWVFTEMGRQPWIVFGLMPTAAGVSPSVSATEVWISMIGFTLVYGLLAVVEVRLLLKYISAGLPVVPPDDDPEVGSDDEERPLAFAY
ncbi:MAG: cytochrome ubiquinol oxidase subunit I [Actinobacteria bacterium]|nr:cytochrome ubiquinol oxidase subunit I [Actinomycetota bacterium]